MFDSKFDTEGMLDASLGTMPIGGEGNEKDQTSHNTTTGSSPIHRTAIALIRYYAMSLIGQLTVENAKRSLIRAKSQVTESGFLSVTAFSVPKQSETLGRIQGNIRTFWGPYSVIFGIVALYSVFTSPILLLSLFAMFSVYMFLFKIHAGRNVTIGEHTCDATQKNLFFAVMSILIFVFSGFLSYVVSIVFWGSCIVLLHAAFHNPVTPVLPIDAVPLTGPVSA